MERENRVLARRQVSNAQHAAAVGGEDHLADDRVVQVAIGVLGAQGVAIGVRRNAAAGSTIGTASVVQMGLEATQTVLLLADGVGLVVDGAAVMKQQHRNLCGLHGQPVNHGGQGVGRKCAIDRPQRDAGHGINALARVAGFGQHRQEVALAGVQRGIGDVDR